MSHNMKQGELAVVTQGHDKYPDGKVVKILSYNTPQKEYMVTDVLESKPTAANPYIMETEDGEFKMTKEEFDTNEFIPEKYVNKIDLSKRNMVVDFILSPLGFIAVNTLVACSSFIAAMEFLNRL